MRGVKYEGGTVGTVFKASTICFKFHEIDIYSTLTVFKKYCIL